MVKFPTFQGLIGVYFPTPTAILKSNSLLPGKGRMSNAHGGDVEGGMLGGMLRLQIDGCTITSHITLPGNLAVSPG